MSLIFDPHVESLPCHSSNIWQKKKPRAKFWMGIKSWPICVFYQGIPLLVMSYTHEGIYRGLGDPYSLTGIWLKGNCSTSLDIPFNGVKGLKIAQVDCLLDKRKKQSFKILAQIWLSPFKFLISHHTILETFNTHFKIACKYLFEQDNRFVPGAGATEIELARQLASYGETIPGLAQYAIKQYSQAFEVIPKALAANAGVKSTEVLSKLYAAHQDGQKNVGFDIEVSRLVVPFNPLMTSPRVYSGWSLWEMHAVAKSNRLQRVKVCFTMSEKREMEVGGSSTRCLSSNQCFAS